MKRGLVIVSMLILCTSIGNAAIEQGQYEIGALASISTRDDTDGSTRDIYSLNLDVACFVTDNLSVGGDFGGDWRDASDGLTVDQYNLGIKAKYHIYIEQQLVPYFGLALGICNLKSKATVLNSTTTSEYDGFYYTPIIGMRYELNRSNDLYTEFQYRCYSGNVKSDFGLDKECKLMIGILHQFN